MNDENSYGKLKNNELIEKVIKLVTEERRIGVEVLNLLQEIERKKAYAELHYDSLFSFCVKKLGYSDAQAARRIQAMRAISQYPELEQKIKEGKLTVTTVAKVQTHLRKQKDAGVIQTNHEKLELFSAVENYSAKEVETTLQKLAGDEFVITLTLKLNAENKAAWDKIKNLSAHSTRGQDSEILAMLMETWLNKNDPDEKIKNAEAKQNEKVCREKPAPSGSPPLSSASLQSNSRQPASPLSPSSLRGSSFSTPKTRTHSAKNVAMYHNAHEKIIARKYVNQNNRYVPTDVKRAVWKRDHGQCSHCKSRFAIQYDHIRPFAKNGDHSVENIRLLCQSCNLHFGIQKFGAEKMRRTANQLNQPLSPVIATNERTISNLSTNKPDF